MKKKDVISIIITTLAVAALIAGCVYLTKRHRNTEFAPPIQSVSELNVYLADEKTPKQTIDFSGYVNGSDYVLFPGNTENGIKYLACFIHDSMKTLFFKYSLLNGNVAKIETEIDSSVPYIYASGGFIYYLREKIGEHPANYLCRIPVSGGGEQILAEYDVGNVFFADLHFVVENKVILSFSEKIVAYDIVKDKTQILWDAEQNGFDLLKNNIWYYGGNLYFSAISETREDNIPTDEALTDSMIPVNSTYLLTLNMKTKKSSLLFSEPINCFYMTEDEIIYMPTVYRTIKIGCEILPHYNDKIISRDLDGKNPREIFSGLDVWAYSIYRYKDGKLYVSDGYAANIKYSIIEIDTNTGKASVYKGWNFDD